MPHPEAPVLPAPALFDVTATGSADPAGTLVRIPLDDIELAPNARRKIAQESIERLARMLMTMGQLAPASATAPPASPSSSTPASDGSSPPAPATPSPPTACSPCAA